MRWPSEQTVSELLDLLYESAATPAVWQHFLTRLAEVMGATHAAVILDDFLNRQYSVGFQAGFSSEAQKLYSERVGDDDLLLRRAISQPKGWIGIGQSLVRDDELVKAHVYNEYMRFYDIFNECGSLITYDGSVCQALTVLRPKRAGRFSKPHVTLLSLLTPHLKRALRLHYKVTDLKAAAGNLRSAIDAVSTAIILFDSAGRVLHANPSAQRLLASGDALFIKDGRVLAQSIRESLTLQRLISTALAPNFQTTENEIGTALVQRRKGLPFEILVTPLKSDSVLSGEHTAAAMFVVDPDQRVRPAKELLQGLFGLTPAEARVAVLLSDGTPVRQISETLGVSRNTLKTQIGCVYGKIGINRQSELIRLLIQLPASGKR
jgi:DNA-binding CsgD family transcriptional regulator/PAS domain-containing protein